MNGVEFHLLPEVGVLRLAGPDARGFLQAQVTADLRSLQPGQSATAAWCTPQGRVIAVLTIGLAGDGDAVLALLPRELCTVVAERLRRFVLRAKVVIEDAGVAVAAVSGAGCDTLDLGAGVVGLRLAASRRLLLGTPAALADAGRGLPQAPAAAWEARCIALGEPEVYAATSERWVPQMLNLDLVGAVSFSKGCYPGQEIVARTQNLGRIKRRLFRYRVAGSSLPPPGAALCHGDERVGEVVRSVDDGGRAQLLAVVNLEATGLGLTDETGAASCTPEALPYAIPETAGRDA